MSSIYAGFAAGLMILVLAYLLPAWGAGNYIRQLEEPMCFGRRLTRREAHYIGVLVHLLVSVVGGAVFALAVAEGMMPGFDARSLALFGFVVWFFVGIVVMPLQGDGFFGRTHDHWFPLDAGITIALWTTCYGIFLHAWFL